MDTLKKAVSSLKDRIVKSPLERSILEVCSDENWGASNTALHEIAEKTFNHEERLTIMKTVWELLKSPNKEWRRLYKVLNLIENLLKFGSTACLHEIQDEAFKIRMLQDFSFREGNEERGIGVRDKAKYIATLLNDRNVLDEEREKAKKTWSKFSGISSENNYGRYNESNSYSNSYDPYVVKEKKNKPESYANQSSGYETPVYEQRSETKEREKEVKDIFAPPEVKPAKVESKQTIWDSEPGRLPQAPKTIRPPPQFTGAGTPSIFKVPDVKPADSIPMARNPPALIDPLFAPPTVTNFNPAGYSQTAPAVSQPASVFSQPIPTFPQPTPSFSQPVSSVPQPTPSYSQLTPSFPQPTPSYVQPTPIFSPVNPNPSYQAGLNGLSFPNPTTGYSNPTFSGSGAFIQDVNSRPGPGVTSLPMSNEAPKNTGKLHFNIGDNSGATMEQMKIYGRGGFSDFQAAPVQTKEPIDLESKLINLDDLLSGQPKPKEAMKSRW